MKIPSIPKPKYSISKEEIQADIIMRTMTGMNYDIGTHREIIEIIEFEGVEKFNFDYPYGSFEAYKTHVLAGEFDPKIKLSTKEDHERLEKAVEEGKLWVTY